MSLHQVFYLFLLPSCTYKCTATSVDAERAFSKGRQQVNFTQHNMSSETFTARMAVGSWAKTPIYPGLDKVASYIDHKKNLENV